MNDIRNFLDGNQKSMNIKLDINALPDVACIKCGEKEFLNFTRIKKLSRTVSPNGQEGNVNINMLKCKSCDWVFNPKEWEDHQKANETSDKVIDIKKQPKVKKEPTREVCRKCGVFYDKNTEHQCK
jgi:hypothetical protein